MESHRSTWPLWAEALTSWPVWRRSLIIGLLIGFVQIAVNQGDHWVRLQISSTLILKTMVTPMIAVSVALFSSAGAYVELSRRSLPPQSAGTRERPVLIHTVNRTLARSG